MTTFDIKSTEEIVDDILVTIVTEVPDITDINPGSVISTLTEAVATEINLVYQELNDVYQGTRIDTSTGTDLDNLAALVGVERKAGTTTAGTVTFIRNQVATTDFTIAAGAVVSTQPNTGDEQLQFTVDASTTFQASILSESHNFTDGVYDYALDERFISSVQQLLATVAATPGTSLTEGVDFEIVKNATELIVDDSTIISYDTMETALTDGGWFGDETLRESCDATTSWAASSEGSIALNTTPGENKEGTGCLDLEKASGVATGVLYDKTLSLTNDFTDKHVFVWYYIDDVNDLAVTGAVEARYGENSGNHWYKTYDRADLSNGWNLLGFSSTNATGTTGAPTLANCDYVALNVEYVNATTTKTGNEQRMDYWRVAYVPVEDTVTFREGTTSLQFRKLDTTKTTVQYEKVAPAVVDSNAQPLVFWLYIKDQTALDKIDELEVTFGSGGDADNSYTDDFRNSTLAIGWQKIVFDTTGSGVSTTGIPNSAAINYMSVTVTTNLAADTLTADDLNVDWAFFADYESYEGDLIRFIQTGTQPDDGTDWFVDYKPLSKEVAVSAEDVGAKYNVGRNKIIYKVSIIGNIDTVNNYNQMEGGTDEETDDELRARIPFAADQAGRATVEALRQAVLAVNGVTAVEVDDLPLKTQTNETHEYNTGQQDYPLNREISLDNVNLVVDGTASAAPYTFVNGTDYVLIESKVRFQIGGTNPDDMTDIEVDYDYDWLGHVEIFVTGATTPLPSSVAADIDTAIEETKAAGVDVQWYEPSVVTVDVTALISPDTGQGYTFSGIQDDVNDAVTNYLNSLGPGADVLVAELYAVIQDTEGVLNSSITTPASDVTINSDEVAKAGTVVIGSI